MYFRGYKGALDTPVPAPVDVTPSTVKRMLVIIAN